MVDGPTLRTERLVLRRWRAEDLAPFAALNADPVVMEHFQKMLSREESDAVASRIDAEFEDCGFSFWAVEVSGVPRSSALWVCVGCRS